MERKKLDLKKARAITSRLHVSCLAHLFVFSSLLVIYRPILIENPAVQSLTFLLFVMILSRWMIFRLKPSWFYASTKINHYFAVHSFLGILWGTLSAYLASSSQIEKEYSTIPYLVIAAYLSGNATSLYVLGKRLTVLNLSYVFSFVGVLYFFSHSHSTLFLILTTILFSVVMNYYAKFHYKNWESQQKTLFENKLNQAELQKLINAFPGQVSLYNQNLEYMMTNEKIFVSQNLNAKKLVKQKIGFLYPESIFAKNIEKFHQSEKDKTSFEIELDTIVGKRWHLVHVSKLKKDLTKNMIVTMDIHHLVQARKKLEEKNAITQQQNKLMEIGILASGIAHEINNPLGILSGRIEQLRKTPHELVEKKVTILEQMSQTVERISKIILALKSLSRSQHSEELQEIQVEKIVDQSLTFLETKLKSHHVQVLWSPHTHPHTVLGNETYLSQTILNLLQNSIDALENEKEKWIEIKLSENQNQITLYFTDSGQGISEEVQKKLHVPFFTTKGPGKGTGLGLSISKSFMQAMGGDLIYNSTHPHTQFKITLLKKNNSQKHAS